MAAAASEEHRDKSRRVADIALWASAVTAHGGPDSRQSTGC